MAKRTLDIFRDFFNSEKAGGFVLIGCTILSLVLANTVGEGYIHFWHNYVDLSFGGVELNYSIEHWINDGLMAIFFLMVGLEIERELYVGELSNFRQALLPILAAVGGMVVPALVHFAFNGGTPTQPGFGIPMATDIAFALGVLSLVGNKVPVSLKIFLTALAIIDDLGAITVIAIFYTKGFSLFYFLFSLGVFALLFVLGKLRVHLVWLYILGGVVMWYCMLKSGVHSTIAGVLLAFAIPFGKDGRGSMSERLQHALHQPVAFVIVPLFALANTAIIIPKEFFTDLVSRNSLGIMSGLVVGKLVGIFGACWLAVKAGLAHLPFGANWRYMAGIALLGGIGFTMSIFITNLAFTDAEVIAASKIAILLSSVVAALLGLGVLKWSNGRERRKAKLTSISAHP